MTVVTVDYDNAPPEQRAGYRLTGWLERVTDGVTQRTNVRVKVDGRNVPYWPTLVGGVWSPDWVVVAD